MKRLLYFCYFVKITNYKELDEKLKKVSTYNNISRKKLLFEMIKSSFIHKSSFDDFFVYEFYKKSNKEQSKYLNMGNQYEFQSKMNNKKYRKYFRDKIIFNENFKEYLNRNYFVLDKEKYTQFNNWLNDKEYIFAKEHKGETGSGVEKIKLSEFKNNRQLFTYLLDNNYSLIEEMIQQHSKIQRINPNSVNTLRVITAISGGQVEIVSSILKLSITSHVDNLGRGGIVAPLDMDSGTVNGPAISKDYKTYKSHPITKEKIEGFKIPYWKETLSMVKDAALIIPEVKTVGWDVAITNDGPAIIEGNDNWNHILLQFPFQEGRLKLIEDILIKDNK